MQEAIGTLRNRLFGLLGNKKHSTGRRESKLYMRLHSIPDGEHCIHRNSRGQLPWGAKPKKPDGISARQWKLYIKRMRRSINSASVEMEQAIA